MLVLSTSISTADGNWGEWMDWSPCSETCGVGLKFRDRDCNNPVPDADGLFCLGEPRDYEICYHNKSCLSGNSYCVLLIDKVRLAKSLTTALSNKWSSCIVLSNNLSCFQYYIYIYYNACLKQ